MSRTSRRSGVSVGHDAFLDIVANLVGILIILVVVLGAQSQAVIREAERTPEPLIEETLGPQQQPASEADIKGLATVASRAAAAQADSMRLEKTIKVLDTKIDLESERRTRLLALLNRAEEAWQTEQESFDKEKRLAAESVAAAERLQEQLSDASAKVDSLQEIKPVTVSIEHLPTPMAKTVFGEELFFRLKNQRLSVVPKKALTDEIRRDFERSMQNFREGLMDSAVGPIRNFVARYVVDRRTSVVARGNALTPVASARVLKLVIYPLREPHGTPVNEVFANDDWLDVELAGQQPGKTSVVVAVYPDCYDAFRELKKRLYQRGFATAGHPLPNDYPIFVSFDGSGTTAAVQ